MVLPNGKSRAALLSPDGRVFIFHGHNRESAMVQSLCSRVEGEILVYVRG